MSYHRGGHPGAVAVSYSTSAMSPLSPSRRYSGSTGSGASGTSGTNSGSTSKYPTYRSSASSTIGSDRNGGYYSNTGYRGGSYTSSSTSDTFRRSYFSPARSVPPYNETSSIVGSSSLSGSALRYGSASSSSASSTASSTSSCNSRDRNGLQQHHKPGSLATIDADFYAIYSPKNYVPNIHGASSINSTKSNNHWRSSSSSSGVSSSLLAELHGGDEYDSCRERRDRSYSSEASSGVGLSCNNGTASNNLVSPVDRWTTRREAKRRITPTGSSIGSNGNASREKLDSVTATIEVTPETRNIITTTKILDKSQDYVKKSQAPSSNIETISDTSSGSKINGTLPIFNSDVNETSASLVATKNQDDPNATRDTDNNNASAGITKCLSNSNNNDRDALTERDNGTLETRRRRRRVSDDSNVATTTNSETDIRRDENDDRTTATATTTTTTTRYANNSVLVRHNCDNRDDNNTREIKASFNGESSTSANNRGNDHHRQPQPHDLTCLNDETNSIVSSVIPILISDNLTNDNAFSTVTSSSSASSLSSASPTSENSSPTLSNSVSAPIGASKIFNGKNESLKTRDDSKLGENKKIENFGFLDVKEDCDVERVGGGDCAGAGGDADHHRTACTWTKLPTNIDNTELLTNNNAQDREILGIVETTRNELARTTNLSSSSTRIHERTAPIVKGARKSLLWTATNEIETIIVTRSENISLAPGRKNEQSGNLIDIVTNGDESNVDVTNGFENLENSGKVENSRIHDVNRDDETNGISPLLRNGVKSSGSRNDEPEKASTSRRTLFGWNDPIDDLTGPSSSSTVNPAASSGTAATASSSSASNSVPVAVHQNLYRGINEQIVSKLRKLEPECLDGRRWIDESSNSRPSRNRLQSRRDERYGLNGLRNIGNTCFMNSVIQCLSNTRPLLEYLLNEQHLHDINTTTSSMKGALIKAFGQVIHELWEMSGDHVVNTTALKSQIQRFAPRFMGYSQQDAQEFLRYLLEGLHEDVNRVTIKPQPILTDIPDHYSDSHKAAESWKRYLRSEDSTIVDVFVGQLRSSLHCTSCDHVSVTLDPFWDLSLPIPSRSGTVKLNQCLEHFTKVETLDGDEKPTCSKCQMRRKCTKSFSIQKFPKILVIHLKRFSPTERFRGKLSVLVDFPLTCLDLSAFAAPGVQGPTYNLYGVANHSGTTYSGHYTAYCKHPYSGEWHEYNDSRVSSVPARSVVSSEAYVLFYEQQPPSSHL